MPIEFQMPKLGLTMEEGTIVEWLVDDGADITAGSAVLVIETDKTETEVEAAHSGVLQRTAAVGETFACGQTIGYVYAPGEAIGDAPVALDSSGSERHDPAGRSAPAGAPTADPGAGPDVSAPSGPSAPPREAGRVIASPYARRVANDRGIELRSVRGTGPGGRIMSEDVLDVADGRVAAVASAPVATRASDAAAPVAPPPATPTPSPATPTPSPTTPTGLPATAAARQLADLLGVDVGAVPIDPADGRVTREGVAAHVRSLLARAAAGPVDSAASTGGTAPALQEPTETIRLTGMRGTIAKRMFASLHDTAQLTLTMDADMDAVVADRTERTHAGAAPGFTDYVIAAAARALRDHPRINAQITEAGVAVLPDIHVGMAVALDEGLIVPVVRHADRLPIGELAPETTRLVDRARAGTLEPDDVAGGTFSVTALGMFGVDAFTPVINPPNSAILGVGRLRDDVVVVDGEVRTTKRLTLSLTWDHRAFDGAPAAEFTRSICEYLAEPSRLA